MPRPARLEHSQNVVRTSTDRANTPSRYANHLGDLPMMHAVMRELLQHEERKVCQCWIVTLVHTSVLLQ